MKINRQLKVSKHQVVFVFLQGLSAIGSILLGKIIALYFKPAEFGTYFIATSLVALYGSIIITPLIQAYRHLYFPRKEEDILAYFRSIFIWQSLILFILLVFVGLTGSLPMVILLLIFLQIFFTSHSNLQMANINIQGYTILQSIIQASSPVINLILLLGVVYFFGRHDFMGIWLALVLAEVAVFLISTKTFASHQHVSILPLRFIMDQETIRAIMKYTKPLIILPLFVWLVNNLDRYLLDLFFSKREVGIYSAAYGLGSKIFLMAGGALVAYLNSAVYQQLADKTNYTRFYHLTRRRILFYLLAGLIVVTFLYVFSDEIGWLLLSSDYMESFSLIPLLALANLFFTVLFIPEQIFYAIGKTKYILYHYGVGAMANLLLNLILIPKYGVWGAGWAMVSSSLIQLVFVLYLFERSMNTKSVLK